MGFEAKGGGTYFLMKLKVIMFNPNQGGGIRELKHSFLWNGIDLKPGCKFKFVYCLEI